eukprot:TRINITY_DN1406_c0_g2_i1.p2 TRINITY_DN1406_c0_g2~~TRINITY_DN1406_c0_g2_i1.p2  ORF type:complete len:271 (+),score=99.93 TRINITY_DN1406_c0_g2_i1:164-976(+)
MINIAARYQKKAWETIRWTEDEVVKRLKGSSPDAWKVFQDKTKKVIIKFIHKDGVKLEQTENIDYKWDGNGTLTITQTGDMKQAFSDKGLSGSFSIGALQNKFQAAMGDDAGYAKYVTEAQNEKIKDNVSKIAAAACPGVTMRFDMDAVKAIPTKSKWDPSDNTEIEASGGIIFVRKVGTSGNLLDYSITKPIQEFAKDKDCKEAISVVKEIILQPVHTPGVDIPNGINYKLDGNKLYVIFAGDMSVVTKGHFKADFKVPPQVDKLMALF